jgi:hypothetical protein
MSSGGHFKQHLKIEPTEGTVDVTDTVLEAHAFTLLPGDFVGSSYPKVSAYKSGGLGAIVITLYEKIGGVWNQVFKDGAALELSATNPQESIVSYGRYAVGKASATTGVSVFVTQVAR